MIVVCQVFVAALCLYALAIPVTRPWHYAANAVLAVAAVINIVAAARREK